MSCFTIDWAAHSVTCPQGAQSRTWSVRKAQPRGNSTVRFAASTCQPCPCRERCTLSSTNGRSLQLLPQEQFLALQHARQRQQTPAFQQLYHSRAGVEGTISQAVRSFSFRHSRYIGLAKSHLQQVILATAINFTRLAAWFSDVAPARTHLSTFSALPPCFEAFISPAVS